MVEKLYYKTQTELQKNQGFLGRNFHTSQVICGLETRHDYQDARKEIQDLCRNSAAQDFAQ